MSENQEPERDIQLEHLQQNSVHSTYFGEVIILLNRRLLPYDFAIAENPHHIFVIADKTERWGRKIVFRGIFGECFEKTLDLLEAICDRDDISILFEVEHE